MTHDDITDVDIDHIVQYTRTIALRILQIVLIKKIINYSRHMNL